MADEVPAAQTDSGAAKSSKKMQIVVIAALMIGEGIGVFMISNALSPAPVASMAANEDAALSDAEGADLDKLAEVELPECRPSNKMSGKLVSFLIRVSILVATEDVDTMKDMVTSKEARIRDRINFVIRSAEPKHIHEPELETIKRRIQFELGRVFGNDTLVEDVLVAEFQQSNSGI